MDGRRFRRWWLCGGLVFGAVGCKNSGEPYTMPKPGQPVGAMTPGSTSGMASKSMWGNGASTPGQATPGMPVDVAAPPKKKPGSGLSAETEVAFADTRVEIALADPPPANRDHLLDVARQGYQKALNKEPKNKAALLGMARLYSRIGDRDHAMEYYRKYLQLNPKDHETIHEIAIVHARWKDWAGSVAWCEHALKVDPENRTYRKTMGFSLARGGKLDDGFGVLCQVMPEAQARFSMARVMDHMNMPDASRQQLQLALQADPNFTQAREFLAGLDGNLLPPEGAPPTTGDPNPIRPAGGTQPPQ